jgi:hypothetical protein
MWPLWQREIGRVANFVAKTARGFLQGSRMIPKSGNRFSEKIMRKQKR